MLVGGQREAAAGRYCCCWWSVERNPPPKAFTVHLWFECGGERKHSPHVSCGESHHSVRVPSPSSKVWYYLYLHIKIISANISLMIILAGLTRVPHRKHPSRSTFSIVSVNVNVEKRLKTIRYAKMTNSLKQKKKKSFTILTQEMLRVKI